MEIVDRIQASLAIRAIQTAIESSKKETPKISEGRTVRILDVKA